MAYSYFNRRQFNSVEEKNSFIFHNYQPQREILKKERKSFLFDSVIISIIIGAMISFSISHWIPVVIVIIVIPIIVELLKNQKTITFKNLANCFIDMFPQFDFENNQNIETATNIFIQYSERESIKCDVNILKQEIKSQYKLRKALHFEEKLKRLTDNNIKFREIEQMNGIEFEEFIANLYSKAGYKVTLTKRTGDQGADIIVEKDRISTAIQAKRYKGNVGNKAVQEIVSAMKFYDCDVAMVITTGNYTNGAVELAKSNGVKLINGKKLDDLIVSLL